VERLARCGDHQLAVQGIIDVNNCEKHKLDSVIALDGSNRFVAIGAISNGEWKIDIFHDSVGRDNASLSIAFYGVGSAHNFSYPLDLDSTQKSMYAEFIKPWLPEDTRIVPSISTALRGIISDAVRVPYVSRSIYRGIATGNSYQTLSLGAGRKTSGRNDRLSLLGRVSFLNKSVLDLGANTGEMSRVARALGAKLVDGYEYDPFFVEIGRAVNALRGMTRVSLFQADCTNPLLYSQMEYDVVLALNVWVYLEKVISLLPSIAPVMVFETHTLDHGINFYYDRVCPYFPAAACLGLTDMGKNPHLSRAFIVFATEPKWLEVSAAREFVQVEPYFKNSFLTKHGKHDQQGVWELAASCFERYSFKLPLDRDYYSFGREGYFEAFLAGLHQFRTDNYKVTKENVYSEFLAASVAAGILDPKIKDVTDNESWLRRKISNKYEDFVNVINGFPDRVPPIRLLVNKARGQFRFTETSTGRELVCTEIDGHHRFFAFQLMGLERIQCNIVFDE